MNPNQLEYLGFGHLVKVDLRAIGERQKENPTEKSMAKLRKATFPQWACAQRIMLKEMDEGFQNKDRELIEERLHVSRLAAALTKEHGKLPQKWWRLLSGPDELTQRRIHEHDEDKRSLRELFHELEEQRTIFWMAYSGVDMLSEDSEWMLVFEREDLPRLAAKMARKGPRTSVLNRVQVERILGALDAEFSMWEISEAAQLFVTVRERFYPTERGQRAKRGAGVKQNGKSKDEGTSVTVFWLLVTLVVIAYMLSRVW